ncbi:hypothetical protein [Paenibacillus campi]|uniref:hypothetical protein n=1 Tax=Paenibacillus campi TaxID=3106031 RepID=UPI002AFE1EA4|nr:hypothetical protein [Paenibacillus sp. SGZ-1009]
MKDYPSPIPASSPPPLHKQHNDPINERPSKLVIPLPASLGKAPIGMLQRSLGNRSFGQMIQRQIGPSSGANETYAAEERSVYDQHGTLIGTITAVNKEGHYEVQRADGQGTLTITPHNPLYFLESSPSMSSTIAESRHTTVSEVSAQTVESQPSKPKKKGAAKKPVAAFTSLFGDLDAIELTLTAMKSPPFSATHRADITQMDRLLTTLKTKKEATVDETLKPEVNKAILLWLHLSEQYSTSVKPTETSESSSKPVGIGDKMKEITSYGREDYHAPFATLSSSQTKAKPKAEKEAAVSSKSAGDHVFNDPFSIMVDALKDERDPMVVSARERLNLLATEWSNNIRDHLRAFFVEQREGIIDANSIAFGMFGEQLRHLITHAYSREAFIQVYQLIERMFRNGMVDPDAYAEAEKNNNKLLVKATQFLHTHLDDMRRAVDALRDARRIGSKLSSDIRLMIIQSIRHMRTNKELPIPPVYIENLLQLRAQVGDRVFNEQFDESVEDTLVPVTEDELGQLRHTLDQHTSSPDRASKVEHQKEIPDSKEEKSEHSEKPSTQSASGSPARPSTAALRTGHINLLHNFNHYHLLLEMSDNQILNLNVPGDGNCFVHGVAWGDLLSPRLAEYLTEPRTNEQIETWVTEQIQALEKTEADRTGDLRKQIADQLQSSPTARPDIMFELAHYINTARFAKYNYHKKSADTWHFEGAGTLLNHALQLFVSRHYAEVLNDTTDLIALIMNEDALLQIYIHSVRNDSEMWLGNVEQRALNALRATQENAEPIHIILPSQMPRATINMDVDDILNISADAAEEDASSEFVGKSTELFQVPKYVYKKMAKSAQGFQGDAIIEFFESQNWHRGQSAHVVDCPGVPEPLELHASLTQKPPVKSPHVNQIEFVMRMKPSKGGKDRASSVRWWYWIKVDENNTAVRLEFDGNVGAGSSGLTESQKEDQRKRQTQSNQNETAYTRFLKDSSFDASTTISSIIHGLEQYLASQLPSAAKPVAPTAKTVTSTSKSEPAKKPTKKPAKKK